MSNRAKEEREFYTPPPWMDYESLRDIDSELLKNVKKPHRTSKDSFSGQKRSDEDGR